MGEPGDERFWPPDPARAALLDRLAMLIERGGAAHFLDAPGASLRDLAPWRATPAGCESLLRRLLWLAYVDLDVAIDELPGPTVALLDHVPTLVAWTRTSEGSAHVRIVTLGAEACEGLIACQLGRAFCAWVAPPADEPSRIEVTSRDGAIAAIYLGLGALVASPAAWPADASVRDLPERLRVAAQRGLSVEDALFLLAVQTVVRDAPVLAASTLPPELRARLAAAVDAMRPHRAALVAHLRLDLDAPRTALARDAEPAPIADDDRALTALTLRHRDGIAYRLTDARSVERGAKGVLVGGALGVVGGLLHVVSMGNPIILALVATGGAIGALSGRRGGTDRCDRCNGVLTTDERTCPGCGATVVGSARTRAEASALRMMRGG